MIKLEKEECCGCKACDNVCPKSAIIMKCDSEGFWYPVIDNKKCINCSLCEKVCPVLSVEKQISLKKAYACYNKNNEVRLTSSSGGMFTLLSEEVLKDGGVIFGATFNEEFQVVHGYTNNKNGLDAFRGSKYVQSNINKSYTDAKIFLESGKKVLFSGTPCQIAGLKSFLNKKYDNLICVDIICHGVPSPKVWKEYKKSIIKEKNLVNMTFRDKSEGWKNAVLKYKFKDGSEYKEAYKESKYIRGFIENIYLRPSCYKCKFKSLDRDSDITLADFWGIENFIPNMDDQNGISLILVHTEKGIDILEAIKNDAFIKEVNINEAIKFNICAIKSVKLDSKREKFYSYFSKMTLDLAIQKAIKPPFLILLYRKLIYEISKIFKN